MTEEIPVNFSMNPSQTPHKYFYNLCLQFKKSLSKEENINELEEQMQQLINASKDLQWKESKYHIYKKREGEKIIDRIFSEFRRYCKDIREKNESKNLQDILDALEQLLDFIEREKVE